ncbi:hypothetical protein C0995_002375 [Termitomyces sp. Mi166|nr:hypothetical protein C0995_002375 [Termitomyces sp. Mi166\
MLPNGRDELHKGFDAYLGHKLSLGLVVQNVKKILEIGAIQAAQTYPEATVIATDISPLPPRPLPSNVQFLQLDITEPSPFEPESFDIIHARFVFVHLPNWKQVLENVVALLKPRGWLWIEDTDMHFYDDGPQGLGPSLKSFNDKYLSFSKSRNADPLWMGQVINAALRRSMETKPVWTAVGITSELKEEMFREAEDPLRSVYWNVHMTWSQKR